MSPDRTSERKQWSFSNAKKGILDADNDSLTLEQWARGNGYDPVTRTYALTEKPT